MDGLGDAVDMVPKRTKIPYVFSVLYNTPEGLKVEELHSRPAAAAFVNQIGREKIFRIYKVSEVIQLKVVVKL